MHIMKALTFVLLVLLVTPASALTPYDYEFEGLDGGTNSLSAYQGEYLVLELFSTECSHCIDYHPILSEVYPAFSDNITLISLSINSQDTLEDISAFVEEHPTNWTIGKTDEALPNAYGVRGTPTTLLFNPQGEIQSCLVGTQTSEALTAQLTSYLVDQNYLNNVEDGKCPSPSFLSQFLNSIFFPIILIVLVYAVIYYRKSKA